MEHAIRDLDRIQEQDDNLFGRRVGLLTLATIVTLTMTIGMGFLFSSSIYSETKASVDFDPLERMQLDAQAGTIHKKGHAQNPTATRRAVSQASTDDNTHVDESTLTFHHTLIKANPTAETNAEKQAGINAKRSATANLPASVAAITAPRNLAKALEHDPLLADAIPSASVRLSKSENAKPVETQKDGEFLLQVISYETDNNAQAFAQGLQEKGHPAFVTRADLGNRGIRFRVRIGPFSKRRTAENYQRTFERSEHMHTLVVRQQANS